MQYKFRIILTLALTFFLVVGNAQSSDEEETEACKIDSDCLTYPFDLCKESICVHKPVFPAEPREIIGILVIFVLMALATVAGIGGGGVITPLTMTFFGFTTKKAIALSGFSILLGSIAKYILSIKKKHPSKDSVIIDYGLASVMLPTVLIGSLIGVLINVMLPPVILQAILTVLLLLLSIQSGHKAYTTFKKESLAKLKKKESTVSIQVQELVEDQDDNADNYGTERATTKRHAEFDSQLTPQLTTTVSPKKTNSTLTVEMQGIIQPPEILEQASSPNNSLQIEEDTKRQSSKPLSKISPMPTGVTEANTTIKESFQDNQEQLKLTQILETEKRALQWKNQLICLVVLVALIVLSILRGSKRTPSFVGLERCSWLDWILQVLFIVISGALTYYATLKQKREQHLKLKYNRGWGEGDLKFEKKNVVKLVLIALVGGWVSGALGLGGGAIFTPLLLYMGVQASVTSATGMYMVMFSTFASCTLYILYKVLDYQYGLWIGLWSVIGSVVGNLLMDKVNKTIGRQSPIIMVLSFVLGISAVLVPIFGAIDIKNQQIQGIDILEFKSIC